MWCKACGQYVELEKINENGLCEECAFEAEEEAEEKAAYFAALEEEQFNDGWHDDI